MHTPSYEYLADSSCSIFRFTSHGKKDIDKIVLFSPIEPISTYAVTLGDLQDDGSIDVNTESRNGDTAMVLSTVVEIITVFLINHPGCRVFIEGSTPARTRLYRIILSRKWTNIARDFHVQGIATDGLEYFEIGRTYRSFVVALKKANLK